MTQTATIALPIRISNSKNSRDAMRPSFARSSAPEKQRAQGKPGARRTRSLACELKKAHERRHHRFTGFTRPSLRNGFNGFLRALPGDRALLPPSLARE
jgi:hypothetical protein